MDAQQPEKPPLASSLRDKRGECVRMLGEVHSRINYAREELAELERKAASLTADINAIDKALTLE